MFKRGGANRHKRPYRVKKTAAKDENIDRQITAIHRAIALKLLASHQGGDDGLVQQVKDKLEQRRDEGRMGYGEFLTWWSILEVIEQPQVFIEAIVEDTARMRKLRRRTPLVGILTEKERQRALEQNAVGELPNLASLL